MADRFTIMYERTDQSPRGVGSWEEGRCFSTQADAEHRARVYLSTFPESKQIARITRHHEVLTIAL